MEIAMGYHSLMTTAHSSNINLPSSGQQVTARLSAHKVPVIRGNRAQDPLVRDTTKHVILLSLQYASSKLINLLKFIYALHKFLTFLFLLSASKLINFTF
jgi:hypothetical protein